MKFAELCDLCHRKRFQIIWTAICLIVLATYVAIATDDYLARRTMTHTVLDFDSKTSSIAICVNEENLIPITKYLNYSRAFDTNYPNTRAFKFDNLIPIAKLFSNITLDNKPLDYNYFQFMKRRHLCGEFKLNSRLRGKTLAFRFRADIGFRLQVYIYPRQRLPRGLYEHLVDDTVQQRESFYLTYGKVRVTRLPAPYATNCINYRSLTSKDAILDQNHCLERCVTKIARDYIPDEFTSFRNDTAPTKASRPSGIPCFARCARQDCIDEIYTRISLRSSIAHGGYESAIFVSQQQPTMRLTYVPYLTILVYLVYITGLVNIILGFSLLGVATWFKAPKKVKKTNVKVFTMDVRHLTSFVIVAASYAGCIWQSVDVTIHYFAYETTSELYIGRPLTDVKPDVSMCIVASTITMRIQGRNPITEQSTFWELETNTLNFSDIFEMVDIASDKGYSSASGVRPRTRSQIRTFYMKDLKCFRLKNKGISSSELSKAADVYLKLGFSDITRYYYTYFIYVHEPDALPHGDSLQTQGFSFKHDTTASISLLSSSLTEFPFSNCMKYDREKCLNTCLVHHSGFPSIVSESFYSTTIQHYKLVRLNKTLSDVCNKRCARRECESLQMSFACHDSDSSENVLNNHIRRNCRSDSCKSTAIAMSTIKPAGFTLSRAAQHIKHALLPKMTFAEYVVYLSSVFSFWLGFACPFMFTIIDFVKTRFNEDNKVYDININALKIRSGQARQYFILKTILKVALLGGAVYHLYFISNQYFARETVTSTSVSSGGMFTPPAVSICFPLQPILIDSKFCQSLNVQTRA